MPGLRFRTGGDPGGDPGNDDGDDKGDGWRPNPDRGGPSGGGGFPYRPGGGGPGGPGGPGGGGPPPRDPYGAGDGVPPSRLEKMTEDLIGCTKEVVNMEKKRVNNEGQIQQRKNESLFKIETSLPEVHENANDPVGPINALESSKRRWRNLR